MRPYIVVPIADAQLAAVCLGMLYAQHMNQSYPMPGPTLYVWDPKKNAAGTHVAFGPADELDGSPLDPADWCLGHDIETELGTLTMPLETQDLDASWFPAPVIIE